MAMLNNQMVCVINGSYKPTNRAARAGVLTVHLLLSQKNMSKFVVSY